MFGFMKKLTDKDKEEKERKRKERAEKEQKKLNNGLTADELIRLEEAKQSLQLKKNASSSLASSGDVASKGPTVGNASLRSARGPPPVIHPKPVRRGFSKDKISVVPGSLKKDSKVKYEMALHSEAGIAKEFLSSDCTETSNENSVFEKESANKRLFDSTLIKSREYPADGKVLLVGVQTKKPSSVMRAETPMVKSDSLLLSRTTPILPTKPSESRNIVLKRLQSGDFGFSLRKGITVTRKTRPGDQDVWKQVIFAESGSKNIDLGFLPGDGIVKIGKTNVESSNRETVIDLLKKSGEQVEVMVQTVPELSEVASRLRRSDGPIRDKQRALKAKTEDQLNSDQLSLTSRDVWISHREGYSVGKLLEQLDDGSVRVELEPGVSVQVSEQDVEKVNPPHLDRVEDVTSLRFVNELSLVNVVRQRYAGNLIHTSAGFSTLIVNSMHPLSIYSDKVAQFFKESRPCDLPPHVFSVARSAFRSMMSTRQDHSIILMGRSGSGKTFHFQNILNYFVTTHGTVQSVLTCDKLTAISTLVESFGSCKTHSGFNSTKFTQAFSLDFDQNGQIASASLQAMMLDKSCMNGSTSSNKEGMFNIFSHFINGIDSDLRKELQLGHLDLNHSFLGFVHSTDDSLQKASQTWNKDLNAFRTLKISGQEVKVVCLALASICHLHAAGVVRGPNNRNHFKNTASAECAARLLGTTVDDLSRAIFQVAGNSQLNVNTLSPSLRVGTSKDSSLAGFTGNELLEHFNSCLYAEVFNAVVAFINRSLASSCCTISSILVVDSPGFRGPEEGGAGLADLFHNYVQERLQTLFHEKVFDSSRELFSQEDVEIDFDFPEHHSAVVAKLIDNPPQNLSRNSEGNGHLSTNRGLLWLLDEQTLLNSASDEGFVKELGEECSSSCHSKNPIISTGSSPTSFVVTHMNGACQVEYNATGWLKAAKKGGPAKTVGAILVESKRQEISELFGRTCKAMGGAVGGSLVGVVDAPSSLRRASSMKNFTGTVVKKKSACLQIKFQADALLDLLKRTRTSFVHCLCPHDSTNHPDVLDVPLLRIQLRSLLVLPSVRLFKQGFPEHISYLEFVQKFGIVARQNSHTADKKSVEQMLRSLDVDPSNYRLGTTKVLLRSGVLDQLEAMKEDHVSTWLVQVQSLCRGHLARKNLQKLKLQHMAIACVQKNVRKFMAVRDWSWWRLYLRVKPLLNVHRTEEELRDMQLEVDQMKQRLERAEKERQDYKHAYEKLEMKVTDLALELQDEQSEVSQAAEMLENETTKRLELEKELKELQGSYNLLMSQSHNMETELMSLRMVTNAVDVDVDDDAGDLVYAERYERAKREHQCTKKMMEMKFEEEKDSLESSKRILDKKINELTSDNEALEKSVADFRRKLQKQSQEMADTKHHIEEQTARNSELEKKQRRFDMELSNVNALLRDEKSLRERLQKERDELNGQKFAIEKEFKNLETDFEMQCQKVQKLERELEELSSTGKDDKETYKARQLKIELEGKIKDLEEELDEQAGTIQQLEQTKLRLEMNQEKLRQQHAKEIEEKENDLEDLKRTYQKKFKTLEIQLEEEYEEKQRCLREKRDLEKRMQTSIDERPARDKDVEALLKRDLRRTKALLQDAQLMLQKYKESAGSRQTVKQLKDQLEDAEFATAAAMKAKKAMELELNDLHEQLESMTRLKNEVEDKFVSVNKEKHELQSRLEDGEEEMTELMKKYKATVQQHSLDLIKFEDQSHQIELLQRERETMREEMARLQSRTEYFEMSTVDKETISRLEAKIRDLEAKLDLETTTRKRAEVLLARLKEQAESEADSKRSLRSEESRFQEQVRQLQRKNKDLEDENNELKLKESDAIKRKQELERKMEEMSVEYDQTQSDLHLAFKRIADLQAVIEDDIESNNVSENSDVDIQLSNDEDNDDED